MDSIVRERFGDAIRRSLVILQPLEGKHPQARLVWTRTAEGGWKGEETVVSNPNRVMVAAAKPLAEIASEFSKLFLEQYPEYGAPVGLSGLWQGNIASDPGFILSMALWELWARHKTFSCGDNAIQSLVQEFTEFVDSKTVEIRGTVLLLNFSMDVDKIDVGNHVTIRKLGDEEISDIYGSPIESIGLAPSNRLGINEFVLEYDFELEESFGDQKPNVISNRELAWAEFDKVIMGLRVFKPGPVGYESIRFRTVKFFPASFGLIGRHGFLPFDRYHISRVETEPMAIWVKMIFAVSEQAIELACSRLSDAETRSEPRD